MSGVPGDSNGNGIPDITEAVLKEEVRIIKHLGKRHAEEPITTSDETQGPHGVAAPGSQIID